MRFLNFSHILLLSYSRPVPSVPSKGAVAPLSLREKRLWFYTLSDKARLAQPYYDIVRFFQTNNHLSSRLVTLLAAPKRLY